LSTLALQCKLWGFYVLRRSVDSLLSLYMTAHIYHISYHTMADVHEVQEEATETSKFHRHKNVLEREIKAGRMSLNWRLSRRDAHQSRLKGLDGRGHDDITGNWFQIRIVVGNNSVVEGIDLYNPPESLGSLLIAYNTTLLSVHDKHALVITKLSKRKSKSNPWFTPTLRTFSSTVLRAENLWKRTHSALDRSSFTLWADRQSARMSNITNDRLNPIWHRILYRDAQCSKRVIEIIVNLFVIFTKFL